MVSGAKEKGKVGLPSVRMTRKVVEVDVHWMERVSSVFIDDPAVLTGHGENELINPVSSSCQI